MSERLLEIPSFDDIRRVLGGHGTARDGDADAGNATADRVDATDDPTENNDA